MLQRYSIATAGALVVTVALMLGMSHIAEYFTRPDSQVYLRVMDVIPGSGERRLPDRRMPESQPKRARLEVDSNPVAVPRAPITFEQETGPLELSVDLERPEAAP